MYDKNKSYVLFRDSADPKDYPTIPVGASVFVLDTKKVYSKVGPDNINWVDFEDKSENPDEPEVEPEDNTTSEFGEAVIGEMEIGE